MKPRDSFYSNKAKIISSGNVPIQVMDSSTKINQEPQEEG
jgi:hypothetical protein